MHEFSASTFDLKHYQRVDSLLKLTSRPPRTRTPRSQYFRETVNTKTRAQINKGSKHKPNYKQSLNLGRMEMAHNSPFSAVAAMGEVKSLQAWQSFAKRSSTVDPGKNEARKPRSTATATAMPSHWRKRKCHIAKHVPGQVLSHPI